MKILLRFCFCLLMLPALTACDPFSAPDSMMDTYLERLGRVLEVSPDSGPLMEVQTFPRLRDRRVEIAAIKIDMLDFLSLYGCELQVVVGERNSAMGRVMTPLNDLRYQIRFINKARQCLPKIDKPGLKTQLQQAITQKQHSLGTSFWNAVWANEPMSELMSQSNGFYQREASHISPENLRSDLIHLQSVLASLENDTLSAELEKMGEIHQRWVFDHTAGQLINSARLTITRLNEATKMLQQRISGKPLCYQNKPNPQAERVKGLFFNVYIARVQPYLSEVSRAGDAVFNGLYQLASMQETIMPPAFASYYQRVLNMQQADSLWQQFDQAMMQHTRHWQKLLRQCGMQPMAG